MTGVAAIGWSPTLSALGAALQGPFEFTFNDQRAAFKIGGREQERLVYAEILNL